MGRSSELPHLDGTCGIAGGRGLIADFGNDLDHVSKDCTVACWRRPTDASVTPGAAASHPVATIGRNNEKTTQTMLV